MSYRSAVSFPQVVRQIMLDLCNKLLGIVRIYTKNFSEAFEANVLQITIGKGLHTSVGLNHFLLGQAIRSNQVTTTWNTEIQRNWGLEVKIVSWTGGGKARSQDSNNHMCIETFVYRKKAVDTVYV